MEDATSLFMKRLLERQREMYARKEKEEKFGRMIDQLSKNHSYQNPFVEVDKDGMEKTASRLAIGTNLSKVEKVLRLARKILVSDDEQFKRGDIVLDRKNNEFGIVIGKKPDDMEKIGKVSKKSDTYLLLTVAENPDNRWGAKFRIRYTYSGYLQLMDEQKLDTVSIKDIKKFCRTCSLNCSDSCKFYQYKPKPIKNFEEDVFGTTTPCDRTGIIDENENNDGENKQSN